MGGKAPLAHDSDETEFAKLKRNFFSLVTKICFAFLPSIELNSLCFCFFAFKLFFGTCVK